MELLLESDEEDASLLEEMERQAAVQSVRSPSPEGLLQLKSVCPDSPKDYEIRDFSGIEGDPSEDFASRDMNKNGIIGGKLNVECPDSFVTATSDEEKLMDEQQERSKGEAHQKDFVEGLFQSLACTSTEATIDTIQTNNPLPLMEYTIDGIQILRLDISTNDLLLAKSAVAQKYQSRQIESTNNSTGPPQLKGLPALEAPAEERISSNTLPKDSQSLSSICADGHEEKSSRSVFKSQQYSCTKSLSGLQHKSKSEVKKTNSRKRKLEVIYKQKSGKNKFISPVIEKIPLLSNMNEYEVIHFHCTYCDFRCPFRKENVNDIVEHITPRERFHHLQKIPKRLNSFRENVKLSIMIAKNKSKAQVRFLSRIQCSKCGQQLPLDVARCDELALHYSWCRKLFRDDRFMSCPYCNEFIHRSSLKKHFSLKSKKQCTMYVASTLQLMSCMCKEYAEKHRPFCIVCNEKCWSYIGHRAELNPVCEACRINIISGNTTKLKNREMAACAICSHQCSKKFVTYWASELEALFIGEHCIKKLKDPITQEVIKLADATEANVRRLVEMAVVTDQLSKNLRIQTCSKSYAAMHLNGTNISNSKGFIISNCGKLKKNQTANHCDKILEKSESVTSVENCDLAVPNKAVNGRFIPILGSFRITNCDNPLPFAKLSAISDNTNTSDTVTFRPISKVDNQDIEQSGVPYSLLLANNSSKIVFRRCLPNITENVVSPNTVFKALDSFNETSKSVNKSVPNTDTVHYKENTKYVPEIAKMTSSTRCESEGNVLSNVSPNRLNLQSFWELSSKVVASKVITSSKPVASKVITNSSPVKYVVKLLKSSDVQQDTTKDEKNEGNANHIIIKTSSSNSVKKGCQVAPPRIAQVIKTSDDLFTNESNINDRLLSRAIMKPISTNIEDTEVVTLD